VSSYDFGVYPIGADWGTVYGAGWTPPDEPSIPSNYGYTEPGGESLDWSYGQLPGQTTRQPVYAPQYFTRPTNNLSPYAMSVLQGLFPTLPQGAANAPTVNWVISPEVKGEGGKVTTPANVGSTVAMRPELPSAQTWRRSQASGFMPQFQDYLGLLGQSQAPEYAKKVEAQSTGTPLDATTNSYLNQLAENYKQSFLQQAQALWPMESKRAQVNWRTARQ